MRQEAGIGWRGPLPDIIQDETIYSWCATTHVMSCSPSGSATGTALLGSSHSTRQHDLPASISGLPLAQGRSPTDLLVLLRRHTIAGYYLPFLSCDRQAKLAADASVKTSVHWRRHVSGVSRSLPMEHPLKWCPRCMSDDTRTIGRAYWHVEWQFPTSWICVHHETPLSTFPGRSKRWVLPHHLPTVQLGGALSNDDVMAASTLAAVGAVLRTLDFIDMGALRIAALDRLRGLGVIHSHTKSSHERISKWFTSTRLCAFCTRRPELQQFIHGEWIPELLWRKKLAPASRWVTLWAALDWSSPSLAARALLQAANRSLRAQEDQLLLFESVLNPPAPSHVWDAFSKCDSYAEVMSSLQVSRGDVVRWLEQNPQLRAEWKQRLKLGRQQEYVARIREVASGSPTLTRQELEILCTKEMHWLRDHSPGMLHALLKSIPGRAAMQRHLFG
jgi:hypothetical protein